MEVAGVGEEFSGSAAVLEGETAEDAMIAAFSADKEIVGASCG
jgi:hypothetical protein